MDETLFDVTVFHRLDLTDDLFVLELKASSGELPLWQPGAHIDVKLGDADFRQYSLAGNSNDSSLWRLGIRREADGRGGSAWIHANAIEGATLRVSGPRNHFAYSNGTGQPVIFLAGGIGITPVIPMMHAASAAGRAWELHYVGSSLENMPFRDEIASLGGVVHLYPRDQTARPNVEAIVSEASYGGSIYSCGPESLMLQVEECGRERADLEIYVERFSPRDVGDDTGLESFEVEFEYSGKSVQISASTSILDAAREAGIEVISSCQEGTCGSCETPIISGVPIHLDSVLSEKERAESTCMMICVSRSLTPKLVLDM